MAFNTNSLYRPLTDQFIEARKYERQRLREMQAHEDMMRKMAPPPLPSQPQREMPEPTKTTDDNLLLLLQDLT